MKVSTQVCILHCPLTYEEQVEITLVSGGHQLPVITPNEEQDSQLQTKKQSD